MSRKIAFRAWNEDRKEWAVLVVGEKQAVMASHTEGAHEDWQQFTGLLDKNGKEIYEGDVVQTSDSDAGYLSSEGVMTYSAEHYAWFVQDKDDPGFHYINPKHGIAVIGNIYENPELINPI